MFRRVLVAAAVSVGMAVSGTAVAAQAASAPAVSGVSALSGVTGVTAPATQATPTFFCAPVISEVCTLLAPVICRTHCEAAPNVSAAAPSSASTGRTAAAAAPAVRTATPTIDCAIPVLCTVIGILCRDHCFASGAAATDAALPPFQDLCTINIRPINPFCLLP